MSLSTMNDCRIPNIPGAPMTFVMMHVDMSDDEDDDRCTSWRYILCV